MYEEFFGFSRRPFSATASADSYVPLEAVEKARAALELCARDGQGIGVLTGPAGTGKTVLGLRLREDLSDSFLPVFLPTANFATRRSLLQAILHEMGHSCTRLAAQELRIALLDRLRNVRPERDGVVLIVDEAHLLSERLLEELRTIAQPGADGEPLLRVVLLGQLLLEEKLAEPALAALNQRLVCQVSLEPYTQQESAEYLTRRIERAEGAPADVFTADAARAICQAADGNPRCINKLADHALLLAFANEERPVSQETVLQALDDLRRLPLQWNEPAGAFPPGVPGDEIARAESENVEPAGDAGKFTSADHADPAVLDDWSDSGDSFANADREPSADWETDWSSEPQAAFEIGAPLDDPAADAIESSPHVAASDATCVIAPSITSEPALEAAASLDADWHGSRLMSERTQSPPSPEPSARGIEERPVLDRYALLDAGLPLPDDLPPAGAYRAPGSTARSPDQRIDAMLPLLNAALRPLVDSGDESFNAPSRETPLTVLSDPPAKFDSTIDSEIGNNSADDSFEARLGDQVLGICLETQRAIDERLESPPPHEAELIDTPPLASQWDDAPSTGPAGRSEFDAIEKLGAIEYDIVEPEPRTPRPSWTGEPAHTTGGRRRSCRRLFSALRRRCEA